VFVHVQVLSSPACIGPDSLPEHPGEAMGMGPARPGILGRFSPVSYPPGSKVTVVPSDEPGKEGGKSYIFYSLMPEHQR
jgi:hypothetical protein